MSLRETIKAGWEERDLASYARFQFRKSLHRMKPWQLRWIISSALNRDYFARRFRREQRRKHSIWRESQLPTLNQTHT